MSDDSKKNKISRRKFLNRAGTGAMGSYILASNLSAAPIPKEKDLNLLPDETEANTVEVSFTLNGKKITELIKPETTLAELIRDKIKLTGTKIVCNQGECGSCSVLIDDKVVYSCHFLALDAADKNVITIEGLANGDIMDPLQKSFADNDGLQCGFCTPGQVMAAYALLKANPNPTDEEIVKGMSGNLCRCGAYPNIIKSVRDAAKV